MSSKEQNTSNEQILDKMSEDPENSIETEGAQKDVQHNNNQGSVDDVSMNQQISNKDSRIAELENELEKAKQNEREINLRAKAEIENIRRRAVQDVEKAHKFALERFASELLPVIDNLERALGVANKDDPAQAAMIEGLELTLKSMLSAVGKFGIEVIDEIDVPFDPEIHQAMTMLESKVHQPNSVMYVMQKGYRLNGRLIRPAMVAVAKAVE